jgi:hypothetical protein
MPILSFSRELHSAVKGREGDTYLQRIHHTLRLHSPQIPLQPQQHDRDFVLSSVVHVHLLPPVVLRILQTYAVVDVVAEDDEVWLQEGVVLGGGGVIEFEAVGAVVHADVVDEGLVDVAEGLDLCEGGVGDGVSALG